MFQENVATVNWWREESAVHEQAAILLPLSTNSNVCVWER
jgi:hypothetical protein